MNLTERMKWTAYRTPVVSRLMAPRYPYKLDPGQLAAMCGLIDATAGTGATVAEIGVAKGDTSMFLLEHLRTVGDERELLLLDTFAGFTEESIAVEVEERGKPKAYYDKFRYGDEERFAANLRRAGYERFRTVAGDASKFDWPSVAPLGAVILDVDLYAPTIDMLRAIWPLLHEHGGVVVDDCLDHGAWDGAHQAYVEFIAEQGLPFRRVGRKGALVLRGDATAVSDSR